MKILISTFKAGPLGWYLLLISCDTFSQVLFKAAAMDAGQAPPQSWAQGLHFFQALLLQPALIAAIFLLLVAFGCWMRLMSDTELSQAHLISCIAYATVPLCSVLVFSEHISTQALLGICLITVGAAISSLQ